MRYDILTICNQHLASRRASEPGSLSPAPVLDARGVAGGRRPGQGDGGAYANYNVQFKKESALGQAYAASGTGLAVCSSETDSNSDSELAPSGDSHDYWSDDTGSASSDYSGFSSFDDSWSDDTSFHGDYDHSGYAPPLVPENDAYSEFSDSCSTSVGDSGYISASSADSYSDSDVELYNTEELPRIDMREIAVANESASPWMPESEPFDISGESAFGSMFDDDTPDAFATAERRPGLTWPTKPRGSAGLPPAGSDAPASAHGADVAAASPSK
jgi:hypothetical protein